MRYSIEPKDRIYVKGYGFLSFAKCMGKSIGKKLSYTYKDYKDYKRCSKSCFEKSHPKNSTSNR